jgi:hypothetical protein
MEKRAVMEALRRSNGNRSRAAAALGLSRTRFYTLLRRFGLDCPAGGAARAPRRARAACGRGSPGRPTSAAANRRSRAPRRGS